MSQKNLAILIGSLRAGSYTKKVADYLGYKLSAKFTVTVPAIGDLPLYNEDTDGETPPLAWQRLRQEIANADAFLFVTPEYNRSIPAALKNAIDVASRPAGKNLWSGKPGAVISVSPGKVGGFGSNHHLRQVAVCVNIPMLAQPEMYVSEITKSIDESGKLSDGRTLAFFDSFTDKFAEFADKF
jgi:chromate reductase